MVRLLVFTCTTYRNASLFFVTMWCMCISLSVRRIEECQTADEFYSTMGCLTQEMLEDNLIDSNELMQVRAPLRPAHNYTYIYIAGTLVRRHVHIQFTHLYLKTVPFIYCQYPSEVIINNRILNYYLCNPHTFYCYQVSSGLFWWSWAPYS